MQLSPLSSSKDCHHPKKKSHPHPSPTLVPHPCSRQPGTHALSLWVGLFWTLHISGITHCGFLCLASLTELHVYKVHPCCSECQSFAPLRGRVIFQRAETYSCMISSVSGHFLFPLLATVNIGVQVLFGQCFHLVSHRRGTAESDHNCSYSPHCSPCTLLPYPERIGQSEPLGPTSVLRHPSYPSQILPVAACCAHILSRSLSLL